MDRIPDHDWRRAMVAMPKFLKDGGSKKLFIGGKWVEAASGKTFATINPATEQKLADVCEGDKKDVDKAVAAARKAFDEGPWSKMSASERGKIVWKIGDLIEKNKDELAALDTLDNGKPIFETTNVDTVLAADIFRYYGGFATKIHGETIPVAGPFFNYTLREPVGVVGQIIPWNFPLLMAAWKLSPALATGCTIVLKPAEQTPLSALRLAELCQEAGVPDGVVNVIPGYGPTAGGAIASHPGIDKVAFTGSTEVGKEVMRAAATNVKKVTLELGGKSPNIILPDADMEAALQGTMLGLFFNQGEVCCAGSRLFVDKKVKDDFVGALVDKAQSLKIGDPCDPETRMGAQVSEEQYNRILGYIEAGKKEGAKVLTGGGSARDKAGKGRGYYIQPTVFDHVKDDMKIAREEIFGPVIAAMEFDGIDDLVRRANDTTYGLAAGVWTKDIDKAHYLARKIRAGTVWVNCYNQFDAASPFGGFKESGIGREMGLHALEAYTEVKSVWVRVKPGK
jgi:acyl-CoA reductase-like NAD-dependent aldehyde dehydrogenase